MFVRVRVCLCVRVREDLCACVLYVLREHVHVCLHVRVLLRVSTFVLVCVGLRGVYCEAYEHRVVLCCAMLTVDCARSQGRLPNDGLYACVNVDA